jgi:hypothetical protein
MFLSTLALIMGLAAPPADAAPTAGMDVNTVVTILLGAGGTGALMGVYQLYQAFKKGKLENEESLISRLNNDSKQQGERADKAEVDLVAARRAFETELGEMRKAAEFRSYLISNNFQDVPTLDDLYL